jgi:Putative transmembrane protein (Alph_Pro_TM).
MKETFIKTLVFVVVSLIFFVPPVKGETCFTLLPEKKVAMGIGFGGDTIRFKGTLPQPGTSIIVQVKSENNPSLKLGRQGKVVFFWMSVKQFELSHVPFFYKVFSSGNLADVLNENLKKEFNIGYDALKQNLRIKLLSGKPSDDDLNVVFDGFLKIKEKTGLYEVRGNNIEINKENNSFMFDLHFSDRAVEGNYTITCWAIKDGVILGDTQQTIAIEKVALSRWFTHMAQHHSAVYGIIAVVIAIVVGLLAGFIFKGTGGH